MISAKHMSSQASPSVAFYETVAWVEANRKPLIIAFVAAVVVGFGIAAYLWQNNRTERAASDALLRLKAPVGAAENTSGPEASAYLRLVEDYRGTSAAKRALLLAASTLFAENRYAEAQTQFERFTREHPQSPFAPAAAFGTAASLEAQNKLDEALAGYQNLAVRYPNSTVLDDAKLAIARLFELKNQPEQALPIYDELAKPGAMRAASSQALMRREDLLARHPELVATNAASVSVAGPANALSATDANPAPLNATNSATARP
jgi:predicted negative regulator of RcsB-dependent stress response